MSRKLCGNCHKRPALARSFKRWAKHGRGAKKHHDLCRQCWRTLTDSNRQHA